MTERATPFHPDLAAAARWVPRHVIDERSLRAIRLGDAWMRRRRPPAGVTIDRADAVPLRVQRPDGSSVDRPGPAVLWIHGGGLVMGSAAQDDAGCRDLVRQLGAVVVSVDYRLAPEHPYPAPLEDCYHALLWLAAQPDVDRSRVAVAGASAGGGLAAALAGLAIDRGEVTPAFQSLVYPMLDDRTVLRPAGADDRNFRLWDRRSNRFGWGSYLGAEPGSSDVPDSAVPARREDLTGLPPAWIGVGTLDLFHDESLAYAERLKAADVACDVYEVVGAFHGFDAVTRAPVVQSFRAAQVAALTAGLGVPASPPVGR